VFDGFGRDQGTAHTDIVKCGSKRFPKGKQGSEMVRHCSGYLKDQIVSHSPRLIICNGSPVSSYIQSVFPRTDDPTNSETSYWARISGVEVCIVLSGFIGRIDNFARRRLGVEVEARLKESIERRPGDARNTLQIKDAA